uniref:Uncharacterized protein n=1 Tax=viral metagenome TaxID=1070528 RepID=A0A6M3KX22_9ZZZZ
MNGEFKELYNQLDKRIALLSMDLDSRIQKSIDFNKFTWEVHQKRYEEKWQEHDKYAKERWDEHDKRAQELIIKVTTVERDLIQFYLTLKDTTASTIKSIMKEVNEKIDRDVQHLWSFMWRTISVESGVAATLLTIIGGVIWFFKKS